MKITFSARFKQSYNVSPKRVKKDFHKQGAHLLHNLQHPSLHAKKYDESRDIWQARVNRDWRFYFIINGDIYRCIDIIKHPK